MGMADTFFATTWGGYYKVAEAVFVIADSTSDIGQEIENVIDNVLPANGGTIICPPGAYTTSTQVELSKENLTMLGAGASQGGTFITYTGSNCAFLLSMSLTSLRGFKIRCNPASACEAAVKVYNAVDGVSRFTLQDLQIDGGDKASFGVYLSGENSQFRMQDIRATNTASFNFKVRQSQHGTLINLDAATTTASSLAPQAAYHFGETMGIYCLGLGATRCSRFIEVISSNFDAGLLTVRGGYAEDIKDRGIYIDTAGGGSIRQHALTFEDIVFLAGTMKKIVYVVGFNDGLQLRNVYANGGHATDVDIFFTNANATNLVVENCFAKVGDGVEPLTFVNDDEMALASVTTGPLQTGNFRFRKLLGKQVTTTVSPFTVGNDESILLVDATGGSKIVLVPAAADHAERFLIIKRADGVPTNVVTVTPPAGTLIDGNVALVLRPWESIVLVPNGTNWGVIANR